MPRRVTLPFNGSAAAGGEQTLVSKRLNFPYRIVEIRASFPLGTERTLQLSFFVSRDAEDPSSGKPTGLDILSPYGQTSYLVGDDEQKNLPSDFPVPWSSSYLKVYGLNSDTFIHTIDAHIIIEIDDNDEN